MSVPERPPDPPADAAVLVCVNRRIGPDSISCAAGGGEAIAAALEQALAVRGEALPVRRVYCFGRCAEGPNLRLAPGGSFHRGVRPEDVDAVLDALLAEHRAMRS